MKKAFACCLAVFCLLAIALPACAEEEGFRHPVLRVPGLAQAPAIDGRIQPGEWDGAAAITGFAAGGPSSSQSLVPAIQQVVWHIGFDDKFLYLAMRSPHKKGTYPVARCKEDDSMAVLFEDHVEIQICPWERSKATRPGVGFYKMMVNPKAAMIDQYLFNGTVGTEELWSTGGPVACNVTDEYWDLEMAIEIARLQVKKLDGRDLVMQLVRTDSCTGIYFAGWTNAAWLSWQRFARVDFDSDAPVFKLVKLGEIMSGELDTIVELRGNGKQAQTVDVEVMVENADGKPVYREKQSVTAKPGEVKRLQWQARVPVSDVSIGHQARNHYEIKATTQLGGRTVVLYHNRSPFVKLDEAFRKKYLNPWLAGRPQKGEWTYRIAYLPYSDRAEVSVDLDFFGMPKDVLAAEAFDVQVRPKGRKKVLAQGRQKIENLKGAALLTLPKLTKGDYEAVFRLTDASGKKVISQKVAAFERRHYPWEHNRIGLSGEVIPPFDPLRVRKNNIYCWGRTYSIGSNGLPAQISASAPTGQVGYRQPQKLLAAPIRFEVHSELNVQSTSEPQMKITSSRPDRVEIVASEQTGPLNLAVDAFMEYDGWYEIAAKLTPAGKGTVKALDMVIDLAHAPSVSPIDTIYVQRLGDGRYGNHFGAIPEKAGVVFKSTDLLKCRRGKDWKSFVPVTYVGNADRGLWIFAWSSIGWELSEEQPALQVERLGNGHVRVRMRMISGPVNITRPRTLRIALQAAPVKPNDSRYRSRVDERAFAHDTRGYRLYGDSVDSYALHREEDFVALRKFLMYGPREQEHGKSYSWWVGHYTHEIQEGAKIIMYGSTWMTGAGAPEFRTFGGEWLRSSNWTARPDTSYTGRWNYQGTIQWTTPEQLMPTGCNFTQSHIDFFVWYHKLLVEKCGINGTWWDNSSIGTIREFDPEIGKMDAKWNLYYRRQLGKRLNTMGWELNRPPAWAMNMHPEMSWNQVFWMVENDWYADAVDMTALQQWTLGEFRAMCRTKSTTMITKPWLRGFTGTTPEMDRKVRRSVLGLLLSHDVIPPTSWNSPDVVGRVKRELQYIVDYKNTGGCLFAGYWKTGGAVQPAGEGVLASIYQNARAGRAVIVLLNTVEKKDQYLAGTTFDPRRVIGAREMVDVKRIWDVESGEPVKVLFEDGRFKVAEPLLVPWHDFRMIAVETR